MTRTDTTGQAPLERPNAETVAAMREADAIAALRRLADAGVNPLQALEEFCTTVESAGEANTAAEWPQLHTAYERAVTVLVAAGWREA